MRPRTSKSGPAEYPFYRWRPHPWHGLSTGPDPPRLVTAYIEITPFDLVKFEIDKVTGYLRVDRPQTTSSLPPILYGFIPRTYCGPLVAKFSGTAETGDLDPMDICVFSESTINRGDVLLTAKVVGGMHFVDRGEVDDKIIAVLKDDNIWGHVEDVFELPAHLLARLRHYFTSYKNLSEEPYPVVYFSTFQCREAWNLVQTAMDDYEQAFGEKIPRAQKSRRSLLRKTSR